jgi:nitrate reductase NapAB chaperone NapD
MTGYPKNSTFALELTDGSIVREDLWSHISAPKVVNAFGKKKTVHLCTLPVVRIEVGLNDLSTSIAVPDGCKVYMAFRGQSVILADNERQDTVIGQVVGIVRDEDVIEEQYLNAMENKVEGVKQ